MSIPEMGEFNLRQCRLLLGLTIVEAAEKVGISKDTLYNYEHCKSYPDVPTIKKIEEAYGIPYSRIIFLPSDND